MPYFVYRIEGGNKLQCVDRAEKYREARARVRQLRAQQPAGDTANIRLIYAGNEMEAEILLLTPRKAPIEGDD